ncbi:MAG: hypothetical protein ACTSVI_06830 [Promethearchaeota archaeon]
MVKLENFINGKLTSGIYHLYGPSGSGKTTIAMACCASLACRGLNSIWIDTTNSFSSRKLKAMLPKGKDFSCLKRIKVVKALTSEKFEYSLGLLTRSETCLKSSLIIVDTIFNALNIMSPMKITRFLSWIQARHLFSMLILLSRLHEIPVVLLNTVGFNPGLGRVAPTCQEFMESNADHDIMLNIPDQDDLGCQVVRWKSLDDVSEFHLCRGNIQLIK